MKFTKHFCKLSIVIRCTVAVLAAISAVILLLSGYSIGYIKSLLAFAAFSTCCLVIIFAELIYILTFLMYQTQRSKTVHVGRSSISEVIGSTIPRLTKNEKLQQSLDLFLLKNRLGNICNSSAKCSSRSRMKKTYVVQYADLMTELFMFAIYLTILTLVVLSSRDSFAFYSTRASVRQFMSQRYFNNETREPMHTGLFLEYLENDFLPTIHTAPNNQSSNGWLKDERMKVLGIARLRQQRVKNDVCKSSGRLKTNNCLPMLDDETEDKINYDPSWRPQSNVHSNDKYWRILQPWIYQNSFESQTMAQFGKTKLYSGGGYICNFGRTMANSVVVLTFLKKHNWIDRRTRVVFIELTTYGVDSNLFNVVTLIAERTQIGYFEISYNIQSVQLLTIIENLSGTTIFIFMSYVAIVIAFIWRIVLNLLESNLRQYFSEIWNIVDLIIVAQSVGVVTIFFLRNDYVRSLLSQLDETRNNEFVSFIYAGLLDQFLLWWTGVLVCISTIRIWKILNFIFIFRVFSKTLVNAAKDLFATTVITFLFFACFSMLFYQLNSYKSASFSSMTKSFSSLIAILFGFITDRLSSTEIFSGSNWIELLLFVISLGVVAIYLMNMIVTISCNYFSNVRAEAKLIEQENFSIWDFLRSEYNMLRGKPTTAGRSKNSNYASVIRSKERLVDLEERLSRTMKSIEDILRK